MKIICGSCKAIIDTDKHDFCPKCGSNFNYSEGLKSETRTEDYHEYERNRQESNVRMAQAEAERARNIHEAEHRANALAAERAAREQRSMQETRRRHQAHSEKQTGKKNTGCGCFVTAVIAIACIGGFISDVDSEGELFDKIADEFTAYVEEETADFTAPVSAGEEPSAITVLEWGEIGYGDGYTVRGNVMVVGDNEVPAPEGYKFIEFSLVTKNTSDHDIYINTGGIKCFADGIDCTDYSEQGDYEPYKLEKGGIVTTTVRYEVPLGAIMYEVIYNDEFCFYVYNDNYNDEIQAMYETEAVSLWEYGETDRYMFMCDEMKETESSFMSPDEGNMYVSFHFILTNNSEDMLFHFGYPECYADGEKAQMIVATGEPLFMPGEVEPYETYDGYVCYEVPVDTETFEIDYHGDIRLAIENTLNTEE